MCRSSAHRLRRGSTGGRRHRYRNGFGHRADIARKTPTATDQPIHVLLDLASVAFVDLSGLDALLRFQTSIESGSGTVGLLDPTPTVLWLLYETILDGASGTMLTTLTGPDSAAAGGSK